MIRPSNINITNHTADFKCDEHGGSVTGLNVNTNMSYTDDNSGLIIYGSELTDPCNCTTVFPNESNHITEHVAELAQAKTE